MTIGGTDMEKIHLEHLLDLSYNRASEKWYHSELILKKCIERGDCEGALEAFQELNEAIDLRFDILFVEEELILVKMSILSGIIHFALRDAKVPPAYLTLMTLWQKETLIPSKYQINTKDMIANFSNCIIQACEFIHYFALPNYSPLIQRCIQYIQFHLTEEILVSEIAKVLNITRQYLCTQFHNETHMNMTEYINHERINLAKQYLKGHKLSISQIAMTCGYSNHTYFGRVFKKYEKMTPQQYRIQNSDMK